MTSRDHMMGYAGLAPIMRAIETLGHPPTKPYPVGIPDRVWQCGRAQVAAQHALARPLIAGTSGVTFGDINGMQRDPVFARALRQISIRNLQEGWIK